MPIDDCMEKTTHRQYKAWMLWLDEQWNHPGLTDHYLMVLIMILRQWWSKKPISFDSCKLKFGSAAPNTKSETKPKPKEMTEEEKERITVQSRSRWLALTGAVAGVTERVKQRFFGKSSPKTTPRRRR